MSLTFMNFSECIFTNRQQALFTVSEVQTQIHLSGFLLHSVHRLHQGKHFSCHNSDINSFLCVRILDVLGPVVDLLLGVRPRPLSLQGYPSRLWKGHPCRVTLKAPLEGSPLKPPVKGHPSRVTVEAPLEGGFQGCLEGGGGGLEEGGGGEGRGGGKRR